MGEMETALLVSIPGPGMVGYVEGFREEIKNYVELQRPFI